ncbi:MAG: Ig-like domain-containing protein [Lachnospiraceae bacterium]|nr:Ig-like domain-containing protein [Lachnospiraceae bacterium]
MRTRLVKGFMMLTLVGIAMTGSVMHVNAEKAKKPVKSLSWSEYNKTITISKGEKKKLAVTISPKKASNKTLKWTSSKKKIVSVTKKGVIKGKKKGKATITAQTTDGSNKKIKLKVTVGVKVESLSFDKTPSTDVMYVGKSYSFHAAVTPSNASNKNLVWSTSDPDVATVDSKGNVKSVGNGVVTISAQSTDGTDVDVSQDYEVVTLVSSVSVSLAKKSPYAVPVSAMSSGAYMLAGTTCQLNANVKPENASNKTISWSASNPLVAFVDNNGVVHATGCGISVITGQSTDGTNKTDNFIVYVNLYKKEDCAFTAHRGFSEKAPANSMTAFKLAMDEGFENVELDIWPTSDGGFVISHDKTLSKSCGVDVDLTTITLSQATTYTITAGNSVDVYSAEHIPTLEQVLSLASRYPNVTLWVELKPAFTDEQIDSLLELCDRYLMLDNIKFISFKASNLSKIKANEKYSKYDYTLEYLTHELNYSIIDTCTKLNAEIGAEYNVLNKDYVTAAHDAGVKVNAWTIPNVFMAGYAIDTLKCDGITSDYKFFQ